MRSENGKLKAEEGRVKGNVMKSESGRMKGDLKGRTKEFALKDRSALFRITET
jgi:hypothetical protein